MVVKFGMALSLRFPFLSMDWFVGIGIPYLISTVIYSTPSLENM